jgi:hypothetical protein
VESGVGHAKRPPLKGLRFESLEVAQAYLDSSFSQSCLRTHKLRYVLSHGRGNIAPNLRHMSAQSLRTIWRLWITSPPGLRLSYGSALRRYRSP